jgi:hypothetical protein
MCYRCVDEHDQSAAGAGAWSGARFARHRVDRDYFQIDILEINGDIDTPEAGMGASRDGRAAGRPLNADPLCGGELRR